MRLEGAAAGWMESESHQFEYPSLGPRQARAADKQEGQESKRLGLKVDVLVRLSMYEYYYYLT
jgi:hypothetical protein